MNISVNYWAILVSAIASMVIGGIWYGPLFGKMFMSAMGMDTWSQEKKDSMSTGGGSAFGGKKSMTMSYVSQFIASLITAFVIAVFIGRIGAVGWMGGIKVALLAWFGFVVPLKFADALWGGKMTLFWLGIFNMLVTLLATGIIIGAWH